MAIEWSETYVLSSSLLNGVKGERLGTLCLGTWAVHIPFILKRPNFSLYTLQVCSPTCLRVTMADCFSKGPHELSGICYCPCIKAQSIIKQYARSLENSRRFLHGSSQASLTEYYLLHSTKKKNCSLRDYIL